MQWFRFYGDAVNDPKVQSLTGEQFKFWVNLLCVASQSDGGIKISDLPFILRDTRANIERLVSDLKAASLLVSSNQSSDYVAPHQWNKRQYKSDTSAARTRRYRDGKRDVTVTPPDTEQKQNRTPIAPKGDILVLPDWLPLEDWSGFIEMRKAIKKPMTDRAAQMIIKKLQTMKAKPSDILQQSIINNWQDIFELRENRYEKPKPQRAGVKTL